MRAGLLLGLALVGCGGTTPRAATPASAASPALHLLGHGPRVAMAELVLREGASYEVPSGGCQDVLALVRHGEGRVSPEGDQEARLGEGRAVRFGHGQAHRGVLYGTSPSTTWFLVFARPESRPFPEHANEGDLAAPPPCDGAPTEGRFAFSEPTRTGPFVQPGGKLRVSLYLDREGQGADWAGLGELDGTVDCGVPEHVHESAAEVLFFEDGAGRMRLGDETLDVGPGLFVYVPPGTPHGLVPAGTRPLRALQVYTPSGPEQRFRTTPP